MDQRESLSETLHTRHDTGGDRTGPGDWETKMETGVRAPGRQTARGGLPGLSAAPTEAASPSTVSPTPTPVWTAYSEKRTSDSTYLSVCGVGGEGSGASCGEGWKNPDDTCTEEDGRRGRGVGQREVHNNSRKPKETT